MADTLALHGGETSVTEPIPSWPIFGEPERQALLETFDTGQWYHGPRIAEFESKFASFQNARFGMATTSGTTALEAGLAGLGVGAGHEVILPPYTFMASAAAILKVNAVPVFCDVDGDRAVLNLGPKAPANLYHLGHSCLLSFLQSILAS